MTSNKENKDIKETMKIFKREAIYRIGTIEYYKLSPHLEQKLNSSIITIKRVKKFIPQEHFNKLYQQCYTVLHHKVTGY